MAARVINNKKNLSALLHFAANSTANTFTLTIAGNSSTSNVATDNEVLIGANITQAWFGSSSGEGGYWKVQRGANTVAVYDSTAWMDYAGNGQALTIDNTADIVATFVKPAGSTLSDAYLILEIQKVGVNNSSGPIFDSTSEYLVP